MNSNMRDVLFFAMLATCWTNARHAGLGVVLHVDDGHTRRGAPTSSATQQGRPQFDQTGMATVVDLDGQPVHLAGLRSYAVRRFDPQDAVDGPDSPFAPGDLQEMTDALDEADQHAVTGSDLDRLEADIARRRR